MSAISPDRVIPLKELKGLLLDIISDLDAFCRKNGIRYALAYGSLLGAVRHKGFIPWDDDIDILMPRPDYIRLLQEYRHPYFEIKSQDTDPAFPLNFAKLCDMRTVSIDKHGNRSHVAVDIFILDGVGSSRSEADAIIARTKKLQRLWSNQLFSAQLSLDAQYGMTKNCYILAAKIISPFISLDKLVRKIISFKQSHPVDKSVFCASLDDYYHVYETRKMLDCTDAPFENLSLRIPADYDHELRINYGDYMQLPPVEQRVETHEAIAYWQK